MISIIPLKHKCPFCKDSFEFLTIENKCPECSNVVKEEWLGKKTFKSTTNNHTSRLKLIVNPFLRKLQFWTKEPYVIVSIVERIAKKGDEVTYVFIKYGFRPTRYFKTQVEKDRYYAELLLEEKKEEK